MGAIKRTVFFFSNLPNQMEFLCVLGEAYLARRSEKKNEKRKMKAYFKHIEACERTASRVSQDTPDDIVGWEVIDGKRVKKSPFNTVLEQISSVNVEAIKPHLDDLRDTMALADRMGVTAEPYTVALVGPPRQGKTQLSLNLLKILRALGLICLERNSQDEFCDDFVYSTEKAREEKDETGRYKYFPGVLDEAERIRKCKPEVLFLDEFQSKVEDPPDVPFLLNGIVPLSWQPKMANLHNKGVKFNFAFWLLSCNNEFVRHKYSVVAVRDRMHKRLVVLDGKAYDQTCKKNMDPSGNFLGGFRTCRGQFGVWERNITQDTVGSSSSTSRSKSAGPGYPPVATSSLARSQSKSTGKTISNETFREVRDTLGTEPRCKHMRFVPFTDLILEVLIAVKAKLDTAIVGARAVEARIEAIRKTMTELSADAPEFTVPVRRCSSSGFSERAFSPESGLGHLPEEDETSSVAAAAPAMRSLFD